MSSSPASSDQARIADLERRLAQQDRASRFSWRRVMDLTVVVAFVIMCMVGAVVPAFGLVLIYVVLYAVFKIIGAGARAATKTVPAKAAPRPLRTANVDPLADELTERERLTIAAAKPSATPRTAASAPPQPRSRAASR